MSKVVYIFIAVVIILVLGLIYYKERFSLPNFSLFASSGGSSNKEKCKDICDCLNSTKKKRSKCKNKNCNKTSWKARKYWQSKKGKCEKKLQNLIY